MMRDVTGYGVTMAGALVPTVVGTVAGYTLGGLFGALAVLRRNRPLHPRGVMYDAVVRRTGSARTWGAEWFDAEAEDRGSARLSRAVGLPAPLPDIHGLAVTFTGPDGRRHDLLLATTGLSAVARFVLVPVTDPLASSYGSLLPYRTPRGLALVAAVPARDAVRRGGPVSFRLLAAGMTGPWRQFAVLELTERRDGPADEPLRFDPVLHLLPGLRWPNLLERLREPAYAAARWTPARPLRTGTSVAGRPR